MNHREWEPGMPERTQAEVDAWRSRIDWLRDLPVEQWPKIEAEHISAGCIEAVNLTSILPPAEGS